MSLRREIFLPGGAQASERINCDAVRFGDLLFLSGCSAYSGLELVGGLDIRAQTQQVLRTVAQVLAVGGSSLSEVISVRTYLLRITDYPLVREVRREIFGEVRPASTLVGVSGFARLGMLIEMGVVAGCGSPGQSLIPTHPHRTSHLAL